MLLSNRNAVGCIERRSKTSGFSLLEIILAITIAVGLLVVALLFHRQATLLRSALLEQSERLAAVRQIMDRLSADLKSVAIATNLSFFGDGSNMRFVVTGLASVSSRPETDLRSVLYSSISAVDGTNSVMTGMSRVEQPLIDVIATIVPPLLVTDVAETNVVLISDSDPMTESIRFLRFRYLDGTQWKDQWSGTAPPPGVEISLGFDPIPDDATPDTYPYEVFRRVIFVPGGRTHNTGPNVLGEDQTSILAEEGRVP